jgi:hypothetical protein
MGNLPGRRQEKIATRGFGGFFCARQEDRGDWVYYFIGFGTMLAGLTREDVWCNEEYAQYRQFYNLLVAPIGDVLDHHEPFGLEHDDWEIRKKAPYILFEDRNSATEFEIERPLKAAIWNKSLGDHKEIWLIIDNQQVNRLEQALFINHGISRRFRTKNTQRIHRHIRFELSETELAVLRTELSTILYS